MIDLNGRSYDLQSCGKPRAFEMEPGNVARIELRPGDKPAAEAARAVERAELAGWPSRFPKSVEIEFDLNVEPSIAKNTAPWLLLGQFHQDVGGSPPLALELAGEEFRVVSRSLVSSYTRQFTDPNFQRGKWYWFQIRAVFSDAGSLDVWRDNKQIVNFRGPLGFNDPKGGYWKAGIYRAPAPETMVARYRGMTVSGS